MDYPGKVITKNQVTPTQISATGVWTLDDAAAATRNNNWPVAGVPNPISKSLRFNPADTAYLSRTFVTPTNNKKWTMSGWMKRSAINDGNYNTLFSRYVDGNNFMRVDLLGDNLRMYQYKSANDVLLRSTLVLRDPSAWYHFVVVYDSDNATSSNRVLFYINNTQITSFSSSTYPSSGSSSIWNTSGGATHQIGTFNANGAGEAFSGYMTEMNFIDGQALTPSSFGMTDPITGVWEPLKYSGTYGTNGFYLNFKDATSTTTLGLDYSGNSNTWATNNFSVTAGAGNDSLTDVPTPWVAYNTTGDVGGVVRGNYATLNPLASVSSPPTFANGNLEATGPASGVGVCQTTAAATSGKFYAEVTVTRTSDRLDLGIMGSGVSMTTTNYLGTDTNTIAYLTSTGVIRKDNTNNQTGLATCTTGDVVGMTVDMDTGSIQFYKNNATVGTAVSFTPSSYVAFLFAQTTSNNTSKGTWNFGQRPFAYTPPSGFLSLCTTNLPASTVLKGSDYFNAVTYTGNGLNQASGGQAISGVGFQPDWLWLKSRGTANNHILTDAVRGIGVSLSSDATAAEYSTSDDVLSFNANGFTVASDGTNIVNGLNVNYVAWNWKANGAGVTNTAGSITSTVSANTTSGFSVVTASASGTSPVTVGHGLGVAPSMVIGRVRNNTANWYVYHSSFSAQDYLVLNSTAAKATSSNIWDVAPTSTVFTIGNPQNGWNGGTAGSYNYVAYCFAPIAGFSAFGSYTGNGATVGPFVYTGFRPRFVLTKGTATSNWAIINTSTSPYNVAPNLLIPNTAGAELSFSSLDILSNGFQIRNTDSAFNSNGGTYIYAAFAENPFKNALAR